MNRAFAKGYGIFNKTLSDRGTLRGIRAAKKSDKDGELFVYDVIGHDFWTGEGVTAKTVAAKLDEVRGVKNLAIYINSPGGEIFEAKAIYNQLLRFEATKTVYVDGIAASAASFIAMAGDRIVTSHGATWMVHNAMGGAFGFEDDLRAVADVLALESRNIAEIYAARTKRPMEEMAALMSAETWMSAAEAQAHGFTDEIAEEEPERMTALADPQASGLLAAIDETQRRITASAAALRNLKVSRAASRAGIRASPAEGTK